MLQVTDILQMLKAFEAEAGSLKQTISAQRVEISGLYRSLEKKDHDIL